MSAHGAAQAGSGQAGSAQGEVFDGLLLALLARKRLLVLVGEPGSGRSSVYRRLVEHIASDGALVLPVAAEPGMEVDDLIRTAGDAALPADDGEERDFDALVEALEERMELAGTGLLAVENAGLLTPPVLADLIELTRSETQAGRFLQILLSATPELERTLARPGLAEAVRDFGVVYRTTPGAAPSVIPAIGPGILPGGAADAGGGPDDAPAMARPTPLRPVETAPPTRMQPPVLAAPAPAPPEPPRAPVAGRAAATGPANDWDGDHGWSDHAPAYMAAPPRRRAALFAGAAATTLVLLAGVGAAVMTSVPGAAPDRLLAKAEQGWEATRSFVERTVADLTGEHSESEALALAAAHAVPTPPPAPPAARPTSPAPAAAPPEAPPVRQTPQPVAVTPPPAATLPTPPAVVTPPVQPATPAPAPQAPSPQTQAPQAQAPAAPAASANMEAAPGSAALPPLEEAPPAPTGIAGPPTGADTDPGQQQRIRALVDQARRQMAGKRLTTPPGDNAFETVQRLRQTAPNAPEAKELLASMEETYRRWASAAERDGDVSEARRFYERALIVAPDSVDLRQRAEAAGPAMPEAEPGLTSRESVLALLRRPAELTRLLQSGTSPDTRLANGKTLLMMAAEAGLTDAVKLLLERRARTDLRTADGATAVMYAAWSGHEGTIAALADAGAELDATNDDGKTALMAAAARGHVGAVQALIQRGTAVDRTTANGWSALMYAANNGHDRVAKLLVENGANPYRMDTNGNSALTLGALQGHVQVVEALKPR